jgi:inner membrane protein
MHQTHFVAGAAAWLGYAVATQPGHPLAVFASAGVAAVGALVPDLDTPRSAAATSLGYPTRILGWGIRKSCGGHRTLTHCILGTALFWVLAVAAHRGFPHLLPAWAVLPLVTGFACHIAMDMLTIEGCPLFWPFDTRKYHLLPEEIRVRTGLRPVAVAMPPRGKGQPKPQPTRRTHTRDGERRKRHTAEWWLIRPVTTAATVVLAVLVAVGR